MKLKEIVITLVAIIFAAIATHFIEGWIRPEPITRLANSDSLRVAKINSDFTKRIAEVKNGLSFWKSLYEKQVKADPIISHDSTTLPAQIFYIPGDTTLKRDTVIKYLDFDFPYYIKKDGNNLSIGTRNIGKNTISLWEYNDLGSDWDVAVTKTGLSLTTSRDWFRFNGFGLGVGVAYNESFQRRYYATALMRVTILKRIEFEGRAEIPAELKLGVHYLFN